MTKVSLIIQSELNDCKIESNPHFSQWRLNFIKRLIHHFPNTNDKISDEKIGDLWSQSQPSISQFQ
jgi:hypothetical protein